MRFDLVDAHAIQPSLQRRYASTPMVVLSALAEGADRLVAEAALAAGVELVAVLPMQSEEYERDFETPQSLVEFRRLLGAASAWFELADGHGAQEHASLPADVTDSPRRRAYARAGDYIVRASHVLIALWDGEPARGKGGTAEVVDAMLEGMRESLSSEAPFRDDSDTGPVYHVVTRRPGRLRSQPAQAAFRSCTLAGRLRARSSPIATSRPCAGSTTSMPILSGIGRGSSGGSCEPNAH